MSEEAKKRRTKKKIEAAPEPTPVVDAREADDSYASFVASKLAMAPAAGLPATNEFNYLRPLKGFHDALVRWALRRGKAAIFAGTGLGKTAMQCAWADQVAKATGGDVLILAPLAVARQTIEEAAVMGIEMRYCREQSEMMPGITITNYDMMHKFDLPRWSGVALDESSILKNETGKTRNIIIDGFARTPYKAAFSATPAPNDFTELGNHAEFLGVCKMSEMLAEFFVHDGGSTQDWRLKGHAVEHFWKWVASWGALVTHPRDIGFDEPGYDLPPLTWHEHIVPASAEDVAAMQKDKQLSFLVQEAQTLTDQRKAKRLTLERRCKMLADVIALEPDEAWLIWGDLNDECDEVERLVPGCVQIAGSDKRDVKEERMIGFAAGKFKILTTKAKIAGYGLNWQHCARVAYVGPTHKWEELYQAIRRCWRFGQKRPVHVHVFSSELEARVLESMKEKEANFGRLAAQLRELVGAHVRAQIDGVRQAPRVDLGTMAGTVPAWLTTRPGDPVGLLPVEIPGRASRIVPDAYRGDVDIQLPSWLATVGSAA